jgi:nucleoside-diphosphate kinase
MERLAFEGEWEDGEAGVVRKFLVFYYPASEAVEIAEPAKKRTFLKKTVIGNLSLFPGSAVTIFGRQIKITDYADEVTRKKLAASTSRTLAIVKPNAYANFGRILEEATAGGFTVGRVQMVKLARGDAEEFYAEHKGKEFFEKLVNFMTSDVVVVAELHGTDAVKKWRKMIGPTNCSEPSSIRGKFGKNGTENAVHGSDSDLSASREIDFFFNRKHSFPTTAIFDNCSLLLIRPHAIVHAGSILQQLLDSSFEVSALKLLQLTKVEAAEFLEVYRGVLPETSEQIDELVSGPVIVAEIRQEDVVAKLRAMVGPHDPQIAKHLRPKTFRALFGVDRVHNAVHCTDLPEDGLLEVEYFFRILPQ